MSGAEGAVRSSRAFYRVPHEIRGTPGSFGRNDDPSSRNRLFAQFWQRFRPPNVSGLKRIIAPLCFACQKLGNEAMAEALPASVTPEAGSSPVPWRSG